MTDAFSRLAKAMNAYNAASGRAFIAVVSVVYGTQNHVSVVPEFLQGHAWTNDQIAAMRDQPRTPRAINRIPP